MVATLSLSGKELSSDCAEVIHHMRSLGIEYDGQPTVLDGTIENGCRVVIAAKDPERRLRVLWEALKGPYKLSCAHEGGAGRHERLHTGCLRLSACPSTNPR